LSGADVIWLRKQLVNGEGGGWQRHLRAIFADTCPAFANLPLRPRKKHSQRRRWGRKTA
jgi:hypothetical protein